MPLSDRGVRSLGEEMQSDLVVPFPGKICDLRMHPVPAWMPLLVHVGKCPGQAMTGVWGSSTDRLEAQPLTNTSKKRHLNRGPARLVKSL